MKIVINGDAVEVAGSSGVSIEEVTAAVNAMGETKQDKLTGTAGQVVGFDANGQAVAQAAPEGGVTSFNGRNGAIVPQTGDYTAAQVGAKATAWAAFAAGTSAPSDKTQLWIDTTANTGGLKYWNGSAWTAVPVGYT